MSNLLGSAEYQFAQALVVFAKAWEKLADASKRCDLDVSELYPFYLLDYEQLAPAVNQWCLHHASQIMRQVPDKVYNPACIGCKFMTAGIDATGLCIGHTEKDCGLYPYVMFERSVVLPFLKKQGIDVTKLKDELLQLVYVKEAENKNAEETQT